MKRLTTAVLAAVLVTSSARAEDGMMKMGTAPGNGPKTAVDTRYDKAMAASMTKMMSDMDIKSTGDADRDFVLMMVPHHQGAIDMARIELKYGKDPVLRTLSESIIKAQEEEIATMKAWRAKPGH